MDLKMKAIDFSSTRRASKRRTVKETHLMKNFRHDLEASKDIFMLIKEQLLINEQSSYKGFEILYVVNLIKKIKGVNQVSTIAQSPNSSNSPTTSGIQRYLVMIRKPDNSKAVTLLRLIKKENDLKIKNTYEFLELKSIDYGSDDQELVISFDSADYSLYFNNQVERDESLWILAQMFKAVTGHEVSIGYSVDIDALTYMMTTSGAFTRFPLLKKIINLTNQNVEHFTADEAEAERVLDSLNWTDFDTQTDLQQVLYQKQEKLNDEIIDFLLQWEEMDASSENKSNKAIAANPSIPNFFGLKDTREVLNALDQVDRELEAVDRWLGEQIGKLSEIQSNHYLIEEESGALESSWQNLNVVEEVITLIVQKYSIDENQEQFLKAPDKAFNSIYKLQSLSSLDSLLQPMIIAVRKLRDALMIRQEELKHITNAEWKQIQAISAISSQKTKLIGLVDLFCSKFGDVSLSVFDFLLKHRSLLEGELNSPVLFPKQFSTKLIIEEFSSTKSLGNNLSKYRLISNNQLLESQSIYHTYLQKFVPLLELLIELCGNYNRPLCDAYVKATQEKFYYPLIKSFVKDVISNISFKPTPLNWSNSSRYQINIKTDLSMKFQSNANRGPQNVKLTSSWKSLEAALSLIAPLIESEEKFIKKIFQLDPKGLNNFSNNLNSGFINPSVNIVVEESSLISSRLFTSLDAIFNGIIKRLLSISTTYTPNISSSDVDGIEAIALLSVLTTFSNNYIMNLAQLAMKELEASETTNAAVRAQEAITYSALNTNTLYLSKVFKILQDSFEQRIMMYTQEQFHWIIAQKVDVKAAEVLPPFFKFPTFVAQIVEMTQSETFDCVDRMINTLTKELFTWLLNVSKQSDKYSEKVKITNFYYFQLAISPMNLQIMTPFVTTAAQCVQESMAKYIQWMVEYEFPSLSVVATRLDNVMVHKNNIDNDELSLYIRRKDVLNIIKEIDTRNSLEKKIATLFSRLEKHFKSDFDLELMLVSKLWLKLRERMVNTINKLETAANLHYQIKLDISSRDCHECFEKFLSVR